MSIKKNSSIQRFSGSYPYFGGVTKTYSLSYIDTFSQVSNGHRKSDYSGGGDGGGNWLMERETYQVNPAMQATSWLTGPTEWGGPTGGSIPPADMLPLSDNDIKGAGTKAISLTIPTNSSFDMAQLLGELREGAPRIIGSGLLKERTRFLRGSGSEYLNVEFGWKPLVNDVQKFARAVKHSDSIIDNYRKASDTKIRRRLAYDPVQTSWDISGGGFCSPTDPIVSYAAQGTRTKTGVSKSWFSGAFRYHVPVGVNTIDKLKQHVSYADKLLGVRLTPELMWNLAPWSWAADWFGNIGDILHNVSALGQDGLAMQYGYMMNHAETTDVRNWTLFEGSKASGSIIRRKTYKRRLAASPYGFSVTFDGLSNRQAAVAAAIGVTR